MGIQKAIQTAALTAACLGSLQTQVFAQSATCPDTGPQSAASLTREWILVGWEKRPGDPPFNFDAQLGRFLQHQIEAVLLEQRRTEPEIGYRFARPQVAFDRQIDMAPVDLRDARERYPVPVVVAVHGFVLGGGIGITGAADIVVASDCATFALPEVDRGAMGGGAHLQRLFPVQKVRYLFFTGEKIGAREAERYGFIERIVTKAELRGAALEIAARGVLGPQLRADHQAAAADLAEQAELGVDRVERVAQRLCLALDVAAQCV